LGSAIRSSKIDPKLRFSAGRRSFLGSPIRTSSIDPKLRFSADPRRSFSANTEQLLG
jgi:hypothetical protein